MLWLLATTCPSLRPLLFLNRLPSNNSCYSFATEHLRCRRYSVFGSVSPWVSLWVPQTLWTPNLKNQ